MEIEILKDKKIWNDFSNDFFFQSWEWGEFEEKSLGKNIWRIGFKKNGKLVGICLCIEETSHFGKFIYCPRGPVLNWGNEQEAALILGKLKDFFSKKGFVFLRIDPGVQETNFDFKKFGFKDAVRLVQVERAWMLDLKSKSAEELMQRMRKKARYSLKKAMRSGIKVEISQDKNDFDAFLTMLEDLSESKKFNTVQREYIEKQFEFLKDGFKFFCAKKDGKVIAGGWFAFFDKESSYLYGASSRDSGDLQASYLVQWEAIKYAKEIGMERHNFWGVVEDKNYHPGNPGFGFSNFKRGFGGYVQEYARAKEFAYKKLRYQGFRFNSWLKNFKLL